MAKVQLKCERRSQEIQGTLSEKTSLLTVMKEKEIMIDSIRRQLAQTKEDLHLKEQELDAYMRRATSEDKDKSYIERKEKTRIHKELETLEKNYMELSHQRKADLQVKQNEIDNLNKVLSQFEDTKATLNKKVDEYENELRDIKKKLIMKSDSLELIEKEYNKLQEKCRELQTQEFNLNKKETQNANTRMHEIENQWKEEKNELTNKVQELYLMLDRVKREASAQVI